jgi:hypothetical protein
MDKLKVILIIGLPCSGKTMFAKRLLEKNKGWTLIDDPKYFKKVEDVIWTATEPVIISDPNFCLKEIRLSAIRKLKDIRNVDIDFVYFENNPQKCLRNFRCRELSGDDRNVLNTILLYSKKYTIPEGMEIMYIWQDDKRG